MLLEQKKRDKRVIKNWLPISLVNVDYKIIAKALATLLLNRYQCFNNKNPKIYGVIFFVAFN